MVLDYYKLREQPFGVTPDPRFLYMSESHREALASLTYGIRSRRGFMSLIAKPGMGKTTILFQLLHQLKDSARTVFLFQTLCTPHDLLRALLNDLGIAGDGGDTRRMQEQLNRLLVDEARQGRRVVVVIDEAQNLDDAALELLRMLSNFETASYKLLQIILAGQPQLRQKMALPQLMQLRQRMSMFARLKPFDIEETRLYLQHRLWVAGYESKAPLFSREAVVMIAKYSEGIPRVINNICFNALSLGYVLKQKTIQEDVVREALEDLDIQVEGADQLEKEPARAEFAELIAVKSQDQKPFAWKRRVAFSVVLLGQILSTTAGGQGTDALSLRSAVTRKLHSQKSIGQAEKADNNSALAIQTQESRRQDIIGNQETTPSLHSATGPPDNTVASERTDHE